MAEYDDKGYELSDHLCDCGCGQRTRVVKWSNVHLGRVKGQPNRWLKGHHARRHSIKDPNPSGLCMCGCEGVTTKAVKTTEYANRGRHLMYLPGHDKRKSPFDYVVDAETGCWVWQRAMSTGTRYGVAWDPDTKRNVSAHRFYYEQHVGSIPDGYDIHHTCCNPACVNPSHLETLARKDHLLLHANKPQAA